MDWWVVGGLELGTDSVWWKSPTQKGTFSLYIVIDRCISLAFLLRKKLFFYALKQNYLMKN